MSELPRGWTIAALEDVVSPRSDRVSPREMPYAPFIGMEHVEPHTSRILETIPASTMTSSAARFLTGDVLYGRMRPYLNKVAAPSFDGLASAEFIVFPRSKAVDPQFLLRRLSAHDFTEFACSQYEGDRPRVKFDQLGKFSLRLPPLAEQSRIVAKLDELLSDLDAGVAELKAAQQKLQRYRQSLLKAAVEGALTAEWRAKNPPTETGAELLQRILRERRARWEEQQLAKFAAQGKAPPKGWKEKYPEPQPPKTEGLPELPEGWVWVTVDCAGDVLLGRQRAPQYLTGRYTTKYLRVANIKDDRIDFGDIESMDFDDAHLVKYLLRPGDILVSEGQSPELVGQSAIFRGHSEPLCFQKTLHRFRAIPSLCLTDFAQLVFRSHVASGLFMRLASITTNIAHLTLEKFEAAPFPLPPVAEQLEIIDRASELQGDANALEQAAHAALCRVAIQRQNILRAAFRGELAPQDPNDEPASLLLERLRAERNATAKPAKAERKSRKTKGAA